MRRLLIMAVLAASTAQGENLLANPGFEQLVQGNPSQWHVFVEPQQGAIGVVDDEVASQGRYSAQIHIPTPYPEEPANNWSQNVLANVGGKDLIIRGRIKTEEASKAALWVQCCRMRPFRVMKFVTSETTTPVYGTMDWTQVEMHVRVPSTTDYVVLRCVLTGSGTAWFDDLEMETEFKPKSPYRTSETPYAKRNDWANKPEPKKPEAADDVKKDRDATTSSLLESHKALLETNQTLREMNGSLTTQIGALRGELRQIRRELEALRTRLRPKAPAAAAPKPPLPPKEPAAEAEESVPPLVPHGYEQRREAP